jgi:hypothetical protein
LLNWDAVLEEIDGRYGPIIAASVSEYWEGIFLNLLELGNALGQHLCLGCLQLIIGDIQTH